MLRYLPEKPAQAKWLTQAERDHVSQVIAREDAAPEKHSDLRSLVRNPKVWLCALVYFCIVSGNATIAFWTPSVIKSLGIDNNMTIGLLAAIPFIIGTLAMVWNGHHSDQTGERRAHCAIAALLAGLGLIATGLCLGNATLALIALTVAAAGILAAFPVFWSIPGAFLAGTAPQVESL